jgi:hypothetical protein
MKQFQTIKWSDLNIYIKILNINSKPFSNHSFFNFLQVLLAQITGDTSYINDVKNLCNYFMNNVQRTQKGTIFWDGWGSLIRASGAAYICLVVSSF